MVNVEKAKGNIILCIRFGEQVLKRGPVIKTDSTGLFPISDLE